MSAENLAKYQAQLDKVNSLLSKSPENEKLTALRDNIQSMINLLTVKSKENHKDESKRLKKTKETCFVIGEACLAKDTEKGIWKTAKIISCGAQKEFYIVTFDGSSLQQRCSLEEIKKPVEVEVEPKKSSAVMKRPDSGGLKKFGNKPAKKVKPDDSGSTNDWKKFSEKHSRH